MKEKTKAHGWALKSGEKGRPSPETLRERGLRVAQYAKDHGLGFNNPETAEKARLKGLETRRRNAKLKKSK